MGIAVASMGRPDRRLILTEQEDGSSRRSFAPTVILQRSACPHPNPLPEGEGTVRCRCNHSVSRHNLLPLLLGEGWGEGEASAQTCRKEAHCPTRAGAAVPCRSELAREPLDACGSGGMRSRVSSLLRRAGLDQAGTFCNRRRTTSTSWSGWNLERKSSQPTFFTMASLKLPDSEVCSTT